MVDCNVAGLRAQSGPIAEHGPILHEPGLYALTGGLFVGSRLAMAGGHLFLSWLVDLTAQGRGVLEEDRRNREGWLATTIAEQLSAEQQRTLAEAVSLLRRLAEAGRAREP